MRRLRARYWLTLQMALAKGSSDGRAEARHRRKGHEDDVKVRVFDAVSGGDALVVLDAGDWVNDLVDVQGPGDGRAAARDAGQRNENVLIFDPVAGGEALVVLEGHVDVTALQLSRTRRRASSGSWARGSGRALARASLEPGADVDITLPTGATAAL